MNAVVSMQAMAKVAWEVIDGVRGGRRKNEEESSYKVSHKVVVYMFKGLERVLWGVGFVTLSVGDMNMIKKRKRKWSF